MAIFGAPNSTLRENRHMCTRTFLYRNQCSTTFIWSIFGYNTYFWQRPALKRIYFAIFVQGVSKLRKPITWYMLAHHNPTCWATLQDETEGMSLHHTSYLYTLSCHSLTLPLYGELSTVYWLLNLQIIICNNGLFSQRHQHFVWKFVLKHWQIHFNDPV